MLFKKKNKSNHFTKIKYKSSFIKKLKTLFINSTLTLSSFFIGIVFCEIFVGIFLPEFKPSNYMISFVKEIDGYMAVGKPGSEQRLTNNSGDYDIIVKLNSLGLRDSLLPVDAKNNTWIVVGDSFTFGYGVTENNRFSDILREKYNIPTVNVAYPTDLDGYQSLIRYAFRNGAETKKLIIGICMENDLDFYQTESIKKELKEKSFKKSLKVYLTRKSALYQYLVTAIKTIEPLNNVFLQVGAINKNGPDRLGREYENSKVAINSTLKKLKSITEGYESVILIIPSRALWIGTNSQIQIAQRIHTEFVRGLSENNFKYVDMYPIFNINDSSSFFFKNDGHWNNKGHNFAATELYKLIKIND